MLKIKFVNFSVFAVKRLIYPKPLKGLFENEYVRLAITPGISQANAGVIKTPGHTFFRMVPGIPLSSLPAWQALSARDEAFDSHTTPHKSTFVSYNNYYI